MKGYLLFFDQILAGYFKHLETVKDVLSVNGDLKRTYFTQALKNIKGFDELVNEYPTTNDDELTDILYEELDNSVERRNQVLDHLLSRFAETFSDYAFLMKSLYGNSTDEIVLSNKKQFLNEYKSLSKDRGIGYNYTLQGDSDIWNTDNISGVQKRIARLLGIKNYTRRNLSKSPIVINKVSDGNKFKYNWKVKNTSDNIILSSVQSFNIEYAAIRNLNEAIYQIIQIDEEDLKNTLENLSGCENNTCLVGNMNIRISGSGNYYFEVLDEEKNKIATHRQTNPYNDFEALKLGISEIVQYFKYDFSEEGLFLVEHLLLKPKSEDYNFLAGIGCMSVNETFKVAYDYEANSSRSEDLGYSETFMTSCEDDCETDVYDPYSYRISVVLPGFAYRFQNSDFRRYAETLIRQEIPAHVLAKICWVGDRYTDYKTAKSDLSAFEDAYEQFLKDKSQNNPEKLANSTRYLLDALTDLNNIYPPGRLLDCDNDDNDSLDGKIILGQSNI